MAIRLKYTGLLMFAFSILSIFTGLFFSSFVARGLSKFDYGVWIFISSTMAYFQFSQGLITPWAFRDIARGKPVGKTCVVSELLLSIPSFIAYVIVAPFFSQVIGSSPSFFYLSSLFIPVYFMVEAVNTVAGAKMPHKLAFKDVILDAIKICLILWLTQFGLFGFITSVLIAYCGYICYYLYITKEFMKKEFDFRSLKRWLSSSWVNLYGRVGKTMSSSSSMILLGVLASSPVLGSWGIVLTIAGLLQMTSSLSSALYPILLSGEEKKDAYVKEATMLLLMFLIPMAVGSALLAPNLIDIFGSKYLDGLPALYVLIPAYFIDVISSISDSVLLAAEEVDLEENISFKRMLKGNILFLYSVNNYLYAIVSLCLMLFLIPKYGMIGCAVAILNTTIVVFLIKSLKFNTLKTISYNKLIKFLLASAVMSALILWVYGRGMVRTLLIVAAGAIVYFASLIVLDKSTRDLADRVFNEVKILLRSGFG